MVSMLDRGYYPYVRMHIYVLLARLPGKFRLRTLTSAPALWSRAPGAGGRTVLGIGVTGCGVGMHLPHTGSLYQRGHFQLSYLQT